MNAFKGLLRKDIKISIGYFYTILIFMVIAFAAGWIFSNYYDTRMLVGVISFALIIAHVIYLPGSLLTSLNMEGKTQLWLHNPQSSAKLLLSKLTACSLLSMCSTILITIITIISISSLAEFNEMFSTGDIVMIAVAIWVISFYISIWVIFYWTVYHSIARIQALKKLRWLVLIVIWYLWKMLTGLVGKISFVQALKEKWMLNIGNVFHMETGTNSFQASFEMMDISIFVLAGYCLTAILLFWLSSWALDKKVEV
ncbi:hypothetical protein [Niallia taxi]|uniref:hypothetical protein n=1 Tax=Niallia taxi TaxID=2499688 RepID=UPI00300ACFDE